MPDYPPHVIRRQFLEVDLRGSETDGLALQGRLPGLCNRLVAPALDQALARSDPGDGWVVVERLDVDVGSISIDDLEDHLPGAVRRAVEAFFKENPISAMAGEATPPNVRRRARRVSVDDALIAFLQTGRLPWWFRLPPGQQLEEVVIASWARNAAGRGPADPDQRAALLGALVSSTARRRLLWQFSPAFWRSLLTLLAEGVATVVDAALGELNPLDRSSPASEQLRQEIWAAAFAHLSSAELPNTVQLLQGALRGVSPDVAGHTEMLNVMSRELPDLIVAGPLADADDAPDQSRLRLVRRPDDAEVLTDQADAGDDGAYVDNAGIVLLHPFLPRFFGAVGVMTAEEIVDPARALCLLHHLATGARSAPEYELLLPKVLCGVAINEPVSTATLSDSDVEEADALLEAVIRHWGALRSSGSDAMRHTFLMRPGKLTVDEGGDWLLKVEDQGFDILLEQLPWSISMIRLPWMHQMLRVEWR